MVSKFSGFLALGAATAALLSPQHVTAQANTTTPVFTCAKAVLHFTQRGFAFECQTPRNVGNAILVVRDSNFPGRVDHVIDILKDLNTRNLGSGRTRGGLGLMVTYRRADSAAQAVCNAVHKRISLSDARCLIAGDVSYR